MKEDHQIQPLIIQEKEEIEMTKTHLQPLNMVKIQENDINNQK